MKKEKQQSPAKAARKAIQERLVKEIKSIAAQLEKQGIHTDIDAEKESKKLAKKITRGAKVDQPPAPAAPKATAPAAEVKTPVKEVTASKPKPAGKPVEAKSEKAVTPAASASAAAPSKNGKPVVKKAVEKK